MVDIKKFLKKKLEEAKKGSAETKKYRAELKVKIRSARREAFAKESVIQAVAQAKRRAKAVYSPKAQPPGYFEQPISPALNQLIFGGIPTPKQAVQKALGKKRRRKKRKR